MSTQAFTGLDRFARAIARITILCIASVLVHGCGGGGGGGIGGLVYSGIIFNVTGIPMKGVNVSLSGSDASDVTDENGTFQLASTDTSGDVVLLVGSGDQTSAVTIRNVPAEAEEVDLQMVYDPPKRHVDVQDVQVTHERPQHKPKPTPAPADPANVSNQDDQGSSVGDGGSTDSNDSIDDSGSQGDGEDGDNSSSEDDHGGHDEDHGHGDHGDHGSDGAQVGSGEDAGSDHGSSDGHHSDDKDHGHGDKGKDKDKDKNKGKDRSKNRNRARSLVAEVCVLRLAGDQVDVVLNPDFPCP